MHRQFVVIVIEIFIVYLLKTSALPGRSDPSTDLSPSANVGGRAMKKKNKTKSACPDTCKLKRRLGKVELSMKGKLSELEELLSSNQAVTSNVHPNISAFLVESFFNELQHNSSHHVEEIVDEAIGELKATLTESQNLITSKAEEVDELVRTIPITLMNINPVPPDVTSTMLELDSTVRQLNTTLARLTRQNAILKRQAKEANELAEIIREQNVMLSSQNNELRSSRQAIDRRSRDCLQRIQTLENLVASLSRSNGEQTKAETSSSQTENTLTSRISDMETSVVKTTRRLSQLESWIHDLAQSGGLSLSVPTTTALPQPETPPNDCQELFQMGYDVSGIYSIHPWQARDSFNVYCEQTYYGGGWTVIQRRRDGSVNFDREWDDYTLGFGDLSGEFWLGNEKIHQMTNQDSYRLHVVLLDWEDERAYAEYEGFRLSSSRDYYSVRFGRYEGTAGDGLRGNADDGSRNLYLSRFGTRDLDNDSCRPCLYEGQSFENCASLHKSGWWYRACADSNLNGPYISRANLTNCEGGDCLGIQWRTWHDEANYSLRASMMMIKLTGEDKK